MARKPTRQTTLWGLWLFFYCGWRFLLLLLLLLLLFFFLQLFLGSMEKATSRLTPPLLRMTAPVRLVCHQKQRVEHVGASPNHVFGCKNIALG